MKRILFLLVTFSLISSLSCQDEMNIIDAINKIKDVDQRQEAISLLTRVNREEPTQISEHKEILTKNVNTVINNSEFDYSLMSLLLELSANKFISFNKTSEKKLISYNEQFRNKLRQEENYHSWVWEDSEYMDHRVNSGLILDILGYCENKESAEELNKSAEYYIDNRPKFFAVASLLKRNLPVNKEILLPIAKDDETRGLLFSYLHSTNNLELYPEEYLSQEYLSKADMVNWLTYPMELGRVPTKIELIEVFSVEYDDVGMTNFYLWKFMCDDETWHEDGWMAGLSGPFVQSESPTMHAYGYTFSAFTKLEEKTPQQHFEQIIGIIEDANE